MDKPKATRPPANLLAPCASVLSDGSIGQELNRLDQLVRCERDSKKAIGSFYDDLDKKGPQPQSWLEPATPADVQAAPRMLVS